MAENPKKRRRGRPKNSEQGIKVEPTLQPGAYACLQYLVDLRGRWGATPAEVARYMILREIDDMTRAGVIPKVLPTPPDG
jgi:hypothetical protein